jgi:alpha-glucosidase
LLATYNTDRPEVHDIIGRMRALLNEYPERMMVGEIYLPLERLMMYYGLEGGGVHLPFNFQLIELPWHARAIEDAIVRYEKALPAHGWPNWVLGNHDNPRIASRIGLAQARVAAMLLLTLRGTPTLYYGDEIGMQNVPIPPDRVRDPFEINVPGLGHGRDPERTPMQWSAARNAGFTEGEPWLPIAADFETRNVDAELRDPTSMLSLSRRLMQLRRREKSLSIGEYIPVSASGDLLSYIRKSKNGRPILVALNMASEPTKFTYNEAQGNVLLSTHMDRREERFAGRIGLRADEGVMIGLD